MFHSSQKQALLLCQLCSPYFPALYSNIMSTKRNPSKGKQRIEIKRIENDDARYICFAKRRMGLFAKASELSTLCGSNIAILVFSPSGKCYSFGSPAVHPVVDQFLLGAQDLSGMDGRRGNEVQKLNQECMELTKKLEANRAKRAMIHQKLRLAAQAQQRKWIDNMEGLGLADLELLKKSLERLIVRVDARLNELVNGQCASSLAAAAVVSGGPGGGAVTSTSNVAANVKSVKMMNL